MSTPVPVTRDVAGCTATCIPFPGYPTGFELLARTSSAGRAAIGAIGGVLDRVKALVDPKVLSTAIASGSKQALLAAAAPALLAVDAGPLLEALPDVLMAIAADQALVPDLLASTTVIVDGKIHKLNTRAAVGAAVGYNYALLVGLVKLSIEVNFAGPLGAALGGLLPAAGPSAVAPPAV